jgi:hypothetical protein
MRAKFTREYNDIFLLSKIVENTKCEKFFFLSLPDNLLILVRLEEIPETAGYRFSP